MYAVVETGGKQYTVKVDDVLKVEKLEKEVGEKIELTALFAKSSSIWHRLPTWCPR